MNIENIKKICTLFFLMLCGLFINNQCNAMHTSWSNESIGESERSMPSIEDKRPVNWKDVANEAIETATELAEKIAAQEETIQQLATQKEQLIAQLLDAQNTQERDALKLKLSELTRTYQEKYEKLLKQIKHVNEVNKEIEHRGRALRITGGICGIVFGAVAAPVTLPLASIAALSILVGSFGSGLGHLISPAIQTIDVDTVKKPIVINPPHHKSNTIEDWGLGYM